MSDFKSFSQKTTGDDKTKLAPQSEHSEVKPTPETQPEETSSAEAEQPDPLNK